MQLFSITSNNKHLLFDTLIKRVTSGDIGDTIILVSNQLMVRHLRVKLQNELHGFAPRIVPLESWLEELAISGLNSKNRPNYVLNPTNERPLFLENWIRSQTEQRIQKFTGSQSIRTISEIIGDLHRAGLSLDRLLLEITKSASGKKNTDFAYLVEQYGKKMQSLNWIDREQLPSLDFAPPSWLLKQKQIIFYETGFLFESQKSGLQHVFMSLKKWEDYAVCSLQYEPDEAGTGITPNTWFREQSQSVGFTFQKKFISDDQEKNVLAVRLADNEPLSEHELQITARDRNLHIETKHSPREELTEALRQIKWSIAQKKPGEFGSDYSDYVILAGNLPEFQPYAEALSLKYEVPVNVTRGPARNSHPIIRRFLLLLSLGINDFQVDDIYQIFADNQFKLPQLEDDDENTTPNIRNFCQFCRKYNLRTLAEAQQRLPDISEHETRRIQEDPFYEDKESRGKKLEEWERNRAYYEKIIGVFDRYRKQFPSGSFSIQKWTEWANDLVLHQKNLGSPTANEARQDLVKILEKILETHTKLNIIRPLPMDEFIEIVKVALESDRETTKDNPNAVLLSDATYFGETQDAITFLIGLNEGSFPQPLKNDFLHFRHQKELNQLFQDKNPDSYLEARYHLQRQLDNTRNLLISRPVNLNSGKTIGSSLWQDLLYVLNLDDPAIPDDWKWPKIPENVTTSHFEETLFSGEGLQSAVNEIWAQNQPDPAKLVAAVEWERQKTDAMGMYDGVLTCTGNTEWDIIAKQNVKTWWQRKTAHDYFSSSISKLDEFSDSPLDYFFNRVLRLEPIARYRDDAESDVKGIILHHILQEFYTPGSECAVHHTSLVDPGSDAFEAAQSRLDEIADNIFDEYRDRLGYPDSPFPASLQNNMRRTLHGFLKYEKSKSELFDDETAQRLKPACFFEDSPYKMEYPWALDLKITHLNVPLRLNGFIDRIDFDPETQRAIVYDYKSGSYSIKNFIKETNQGLSFQLPVYGLALLKNGIKSFVGAYYFLPVEGAQSQIGLQQFFGDITFLKGDKIHYGKRLKSDYKGLMSKQEIQSFLDKIVAEKITNIVHLIYNGIFHLPLNGEKKYSDFRIISRYQPLVQEERLRTEQEQETARYFYPKEIMNIDQ